QPVFFAELVWPVLVASATDVGSKRYTPVSRFPAVVRDLAVVVDQEVTAASILETVKAVSTMLSSTEIFDVYRGTEIGAGKKSVAFSLSFRAGRTLTDQEVDALIDQIVASLSSKWNAQLRAK
ncbi:MAG TPA: phenylalanine--tRNA ligase subunit beta, partial [Rhodothermales bacterium]